MTTACCPPVTLAASRPSWLHSWLATGRRVWAAWREQSRLQAELQALEQLGDSTRRDLGLAERAPLAMSRILWEHERGSW